MDGLEVWIDIGFIDQNAKDVTKELKQAEVPYQHAHFHLVVGTRHVLSRAWCLFELILRARAGRASWVMFSTEMPSTESIFGGLEDAGAYVYGSQRPGGRAVGAFYSRMKAFDERDLDAIRRKIEKMYSEDEFDEMVTRMVKAAAVVNSPCCRDLRRRPSLSDEEREELLPPLPPRGGGVTVL
eukprot:CAMPEP_0113697984 /NCGR_PEP_ID=MMETSP0038_2-20120614/22447_1 /TAXON_ID=2898 /ORGANISM="Cryptomonas paramecium" /LENGTH=182 /DNA_ID=CAMNT_0000621075 /DNA_START=1 /DNA_END=549 /DNA_ORIENTATION=+ /assembly_acc=CAM_ASM_000170